MSAASESSNPSLHDECQSSADLLKKAYGLSQLLGQSRNMQLLREEIIRISPYDVNVLILGESGTGKELCARAIHGASPRIGRPFVPVNCGAIPDTLFENEMFGHVKGAFTDAGPPQTGLVQEAEGGTLFLDEIGTLSLLSQAKLLRLVQNRDYKRLGDAKPQRADIRIVAATNKDLRSLVAEGKFREDLYYRISTVPLHVVPLRERPNDIPILAQHFLQKYATEYRKPMAFLSGKTLSVLMAHSWLGNIRELESTIQRAVVISESPEIDLETVLMVLASEMGGPGEVEPFDIAKKRAADCFEIAYLSRLLRLHGGNVASAARQAGKGRTSMWNLIRKHSLSMVAFRR